MDKTMELENVLDRLGWYVYMLVDSSNLDVLYVGKGKGNVALLHSQGIFPEDDLKDANGASIFGSGIGNHAYNMDMIKAILKDGRKVEPYFIRYELDEPTADQVAEICSDIFFWLNEDLFYQNNFGWGRGVKSIEKIICQYSPLD